MTTLRETDWTLDLDADDALRGQGADPSAMRQRNPRIVERAEAALELARPLLRPVVLSSEWLVVAHAADHLQLEDRSFACGEWAAARLAPAQRLVAAVCTVGEALEAEVARRFAEDPVTALALDGVGSAAIDKLAAQACRRFQRRARIDHLRGAVHCWPGSTQWPTEEAQPQVFALVDPGGEYAADVRLLPSFVMRPLKSLTLLVGLTPSARATEHECDVCAVAASCRHRRAGRS